MADKELIYSVKIDGVNENLNALTGLKDAINQLTLEKKQLAQEEKELQKAIKDNTITVEEAEQQQISIAERQVENSLTIKELNKEYRANEKAVQDSVSTDKAKEGSLEAMRIELRNNQQAYVKLSAEERNNEAIGGKLQKQIKEQSDELKDLEKNIGITSRSVGDYGQAVSSVTPLMGNFGMQIDSIRGQLTSIKTALTGLKGSFVGVNAGTKVANGGLKSFAIALVSTGIGAIVVALGLLVGAFLSTQRGTDAMTRALAPLKEIFQVFIGFLQNTAFKVLDRLKEAFENPKQALSDLLDFIKQNAINRLNGVLIFFEGWGNTFIGTFQTLGLRLKKILNDVPIIGSGLDDEALKQLDKDIEKAQNRVLEGATQMANGVIQAGSGIEDGLNKIANAYSDVADAVDISTQRANEMANLQIKIEESEIRFNLLKQRGIRAFEEQKKIAEDVLLTDEERLQATRNAQQILEDNVKLENDLIQKRINLAKLKTEANDTDREALKEIADLQAEQERVQAEAIGKSIELRNKENSIIVTAIKKEEEAKLKAIEDEQEKQLAQLDFKIKMLELESKLELETSEKTAEEKYKIEKELLEKTFALEEEKRKLNGEESILATKENEIALLQLKNAFEQEQKEIEETKKEEEKKVEEEENKAIYEQGLNSAKELADTALQVFEDRSNRKKELELANLNSQLEQGLISQEDFEKSREAIERKAFNDKKKQDTAQAIINGALAITRALATSGLLGLLQVGTITATTVAQVGTIQAQKFSKGGVLSGASHENGGVPMSVDGKLGYEAEGGEVVINKRSSSMFLPQLDAINRAGGGVSLMSPNMGNLSMFRNGGVMSASNVSNSINAEQVASIVSASIGKIQVVNNATDTANVNGRVNQIKNLSTF